MKQWKLEANHIVSSEFTSQTLICNQKSEISIWAWYSSLISFITLEGFRRKIWHIRSGFHQFLCDTATWRPSSTRLRLFCDALNTHWRAVVHTPAGRWWMMFVKLQEHSAQQVWFANHLCASLWSRNPPRENAKRKSHQSHWQTHSQTPSRSDDKHKNRH